jgi:predicted RNase H-like HicB family nuclease
MAQITFHVSVNEEDDGSYWAEVKELPGCFASGFSIEELQEALLEAMQMCLPEGITFDNPKWDLGEDVKRRGRKSAAKRQMVVCA